MKLIYFEIGGINKSQEFLHYGIDNVAKGRKSKVILDYIHTKMNETKKRHFSFKLNNLFIFLFSLFSFHFRLCGYEIIYLSTEL